MLYRETTVSTPAVEYMSDYIFNMEQHKIDEMLEMVYEIEDAAEKSVTMPDLLEGCLELSNQQMDQFMLALASGSREDLGYIFAVLSDVKAKIVSERTRQEFLYG